MSEVKVRAELSRARPRREVRVGVKKEEMCVERSIIDKILRESIRK